MATETDLGPIYGDANPSIPCGYSAPPEQPKRRFNWPVILTFFVAVPTVALAVYFLAWVVMAVSS